MLREGQIVLFPFPETNQKSGKWRPALVLRRCPTQYEDWLICMISSQTIHLSADINELIAEEDSDFNDSGLKTASVIRLTRLAVVDQRIFLGSIGAISSSRLRRLKQKLADWITDPSTSFS